MKNALKRWWDGQIERGEYDTSTGRVVRPERLHRHWTATVSRAVLSFFGREWKWLCGFGVAAFTLYLGYLQVSCG